MVGIPELHSALSPRRFFPTPPYSYVYQNGSLEIHEYSYLKVPSACCRVVLRNRFLGNWFHSPSAMPIYYYVESHNRQLLSYVYYMNRFQGFGVLSAINLPAIFIPWLLRNIHQLSDSMIVPQGIGRGSHGEK